MTTPSTLEFWKLYRPSACSLDLKGNDAESVFDEILANLVKAKLLDPSLREVAKTALIQRERMASSTPGK